MVVKQKSVEFPLGMLQVPSLLLVIDLLIDVAVLEDVVDASSHDVSCWLAQVQRFVFRPLFRDDHVENSWSIGPFW